MTISEEHLASLEKWDAVTNGYPCSMAGCNMTASELRLLVAEVRLLRKALEIAAEQFVVEASGTVEGHVAALLNEAREALEGA